MSVLKSEIFISDVEKQFHWYAANANWEIADCYLEAVEATCRLLENHPSLGPSVRFSHPRLRNWRFVVVLRPFQKHILFYEILDSNVVLRRVMHGHRNLPSRLRES